MPRKYVPVRRALTEAATRRRIVAAAVELHGTHGPAATTVSAIAERAGVQRHTVYRHFPTTVDLLRACGAHFVAEYPPPDVRHWRGAHAERDARRALGELYSYYATHAAAIANILRDRDRLPVGGGFLRLHEAAAAALAAMWSDAPPALAATAWLVTDFGAWLSLMQRGLDAAAAVDTAASLLICAAHRASPA